GQGANSAYARFTAVERAFSSSLQLAYTQESSAMGYSAVRAEFMARMEVALGEPGSASSLDTIYRTFESGLEALATRPDDYATRANVVSDAQALVESLNDLSFNVQELRRETENQMQAHVADLNDTLSTLAEVNKQL